MKNVLFDERQTLGSVRFWTSWRFAVVLFCVAAYFVSEERNRSEEGDLFLVVGTGVMLISILFIYMAILSLYYIVALKYLSILSFFLLTLLILDKFLENINIHLPFLRGLRYFMVINAAILMGCIDFLKGIKNNVWEPTKRNQ